MSHLDQEKNKNGQETVCFFENVITDRSSLKCVRTGREGIHQPTPLPPSSFQRYVEGIRHQFIILQAGAILV